MSRFYTGSVSNSEAEIFLTLDATETGRPCKIEVTGDDAFADPDFATSITPAADGTPWFQIAPINLKGIQFAIKIFFCPQSLKDALEALIKPTRSTSATVRVRLNSPKRIIDVQAKAAPAWTSAGNFSGSMIADVSFTFISTGAGA